MLSGATGNNGKTPPWILLFDRTSPPTSNVGDRPPPPTSRLDTHPHTIAAYFLHPHSSHTTATDFHRIHNPYREIPPTKFLPLTHIFGPGPTAVHAGSPSTFPWRQLPRTSPVFRPVLYCAHNLSVVQRSQCRPFHLHLSRNSDQRSKGPPSAVRYAESALTLLPDPQHSA